MSIGIDAASHRWRTWRVILAADTDTLLTDFKPSALTAAISNKVVGVRPHSAVAIRCFGLGSDNDTVILRISGWMGSGGNAPKNTVGVGQVLYHTTCSLGAQTSADAPLSNPEWGSGTWREVDVYTDTSNAANATVLGAALQALVIVPTLWYTHLLLEFDTFTGATKFGVMWREFAADITV